MVWPSKKVRERIVWQSEQAKSGSEQVKERCDQVNKGEDGMSKQASNVATN